MNPVVAIIPFYKHTDQLHRCIEHLRRQTVPVEIFVRDNTYDNILFTAAVNEGILRFMDSPGEILVLLNQDMYLLPDALAALVRCLEDHPAAGIAAPLQLDPDRPDYVIAAGGTKAFPVGHSPCGPVGHFTQDQPIPWASGACLALRKAMIKQIGLLDANMAFLASDSDYCFTARSRGWQVWLAARARGFHQPHAAMSADRELELRKLKDVLYFAKKWLTGELFRNLADASEERDSAVIRQWIEKISESIRHYSSEESRS